MFVSTCECYIHVRRRHYIIHPLKSDRTMLGLEGGVSTKVINFNDEHVKTVLRSVQGISMIIRRQAASYYYYISLAI